MRRHPVPEWARRSTATVLPLLIPVDVPSAQLKRMATDIGATAFDVKSVIELQSQLLSAAIRIDNQAQIRIVIETVQNVLRDKQHALHYLELWCTTTTQRVYEIASQDELCAILEHDEMVLRAHLVPLTLQGPPHYSGIERALALVDRLANIHSKRGYPFLAPTEIYSRYIPAYIKLRVTPLVELTGSPEKAKAACKLATETQLAWNALTVDLSDTASLECYVIATNAMCYIQDTHAWLFLRLLCNYALTLLQCNRDDPDTTLFLYAVLQMIRAKRGSNSVTGLFNRLETRTESGKRHQRDVFNAIKANYTPSSFGAYLQQTANLTETPGELLGDGLVGRHVIAGVARESARIRALSNSSSSSSVSPVPTVAANMEYGALINNQATTFDAFRPPLATMESIKREVDRTEAALVQALATILKTEESVQQSLFSQEQVSQAKAGIVNIVF